ncbi:MAG: hypothetical protein SZ59_C0002G0290 [candidate division TM6 bacterium GW2011_GWF2_28_16]|nr:MAG: hypothetical protein SZ59_C0002G0290 [candidate division TM6 bacterium GW2011_GWF2_28_16]
MKNLNLKILFILLISSLLFYWPGIVAYHNPRYINAVYPIIIFLFVYCFYLFSKLNINKYFKNIILFIIFIIIIFYIKSGFYNNLSSIKNNAQNSILYKSKFEKFFNKNKFNKNNNFIIFGVPFVSDMQYIFQIFLKNLNTRVAHIRHSSLAESGCMGCRATCKTKNVKSEFKWIRENNKLGFRLTSLDPEHCGWWISFSHFPLKWSEQERAYIWTEKEPELDTWHKYSMGEFKIHKREKTGQLTDVTYLIDDKWVDKNTVFITWDSFTGEYIVIGSENFKGEDL